MTKAQVEKMNEQIRKNVARVEFEDDIAKMFNIAISNSPDFKAVFELLRARGIEITLSNKDCIRGMYLRCNVKKETFN